MENTKKSMKRIKISLIIFMIMYYSFSFTELLVNKMIGNGLKAENSVVILKIQSILFYGLRFLAPICISVIIWEIVCILLQIYKNKL